MSNGTSNGTLLCQCWDDIPLSFGPDPLCLVHNHAWLGYPVVDIPVPDRKGEDFSPKELTA